MDEGRFKVGDVIQREDDGARFVVLQSNYATGYWTRSMPAGEESYLPEKAVAFYGYRRLGSLDGMDARGEIVVTYQSIDRYRRRRTFKTMKSARKFATDMVGERAEIGLGYAVSCDGVGKITVKGCTLAELFGRVE